MIINFDKINLNVAEPHYLPTNKTHIFFLHGFSGSANDWNKITEGINKNFIPIPIDIIGHGKSDAPDELKYYKADSLIDQLKKITSHFTKEKFILCGYSMGGRLALSFANKYPESLKGLILESSTYGIKDETEREVRIKQDKELTEFIRTHTIDEFVEYWLSKEIFYSLKKLPEEEYDLIKNQKRQNNKVGLINSLLGFGTGSMPCVYDELQNLLFPTLLLTGELDKKFTEINKEICKQMKNAEHLIIESTGHNIHTEKPDEFIKAINDFSINL